MIKNNEDIFNEYLEKNYNYLLFEVSSNLCSKVKYRDNTIHYAMFSEVVIELKSRLHKNNKFLKNETVFIKYFTMALKNYYNWNVKQLNTKKKDNKLLTYTQCINDDDKTERYSNNDYKKELIEHEVTDIKTKQYLKQLVDDNITVERGLLFYDVLKYVNTLSLEEQFLFEYRFIKGLDAKTIYKTIQSKVSFSYSYSTLNNKIAALKNKIKHEFNNDPPIDSIS